MLPAIETALQRLGDEVTVEERENILRLVSQIVEARNASSLPKLRDVLSELDKVTEPLAARLIEGIMERRTRPESAQGS
jgi:vacuolar-type H+-ATPase subunit E/Vma4